MLKIKSRAILAFAGLMVAAFAFAGALQVSADMVSLPSAGVSKSSSVENVKNLQSFLNWTLGAQITPLVVDGVYGAKTTAAIKMFQSANGLVADGAFGPKSSAKAAALQANAGGGVVYPSGCASNSGFSSTTGLPCSSGASWPAGCTSNAGFSSTTGVPCNSPVGGTLPAGCATASGYSVTTGAPCSATTVGSGTNGYLSDFASDSTNRVSTVYESEQDKVVAGFRATARLSSQTVNRVRVQMKNTDNVGSSVNLAKYISSASLWMGSTKIATMAVGSADRSTSDDTYTFNFSGIAAMTAQDQIGRYYVSVSANGSLDSVDATNANWAVVFPDGGVQAVSPDGSVDTYNASSGNVGALATANSGFTFGKFSANGVKAEINLSVNNPSAGIVAVNNTAATNGVTVLKFTVKATNSNLTLRRVPIQVVSSSGNVSAKINTIKLYNGTNIVDSLDGSNGFTVSAGAITTTPTAAATTTGYIFSNLSSPYNMVTSGATSEYSIVVDLKQVSGNYSEGQTLTFSMANADILLVANLGVNDTNGDQLPAGSTYRIGSAVGNIMTLRINGVQVVLGTPSYNIVTDSGNVTQVTYTIPVTATAFGQTLYTGQAIQNADAASGTGAAAGAFSFSFEDSSAPATHINAGGALVTALSLSSNDALIENLGFRLDSGTAKHFTLTVTMITPSTNARSYRVVVNQILTFTDNAASVAASNQELDPEQNYQTGYQYITS